MAPTKIDIDKKFEKLECSDPRKVIMTILKKDLAKIKNKKVLEIGCGNWSFCKDILEKQECEWYGLDILNTKLSNIKGTIDNIPFHDGTFDVVICNQVFEHIYEYGVSFNIALAEINRVLKYGGRLMVNVPIHYHGHPYFLLNKWHYIYNEFYKHFFIYMNSYYNKKEKLWRKLGDKGILAKIGYPNWLFKKDDFTHIMVIDGFKLWTTKRTETINTYRKLNMILRFTKEMMFCWFK